MAGKTGESGDRLESQAPQTIVSLIRARHKKVLTFVGYSDAGYEDVAALLDHAHRCLQRFDPKDVLVNSGATAAGIGAIYPLAKAAGFETIGIVSELARRDNVPLSSAVDTVYFVRDTTWGGQLPGSTALSPTSETMVGASDILIGIGGGSVARDELLAARAAGKPVEFFAADMNHRIARGKARRAGSAEPTDFRGAAHHALLIVN